MAIEIRKAERRKAKLRLGIAAPSGAGKTWGALKIAFGLGGKIGMVDTEHGSGDLYAHLGEYDIISLAAPYTCERYVEAIRAFEAAGYTTIIIDSLSHAWAMEGGLLQKHATESQKTNNSYTAWRNVTPQHNALVEAMLQSKCHIIATMRAKQEYATEKNDQGKTIVRKLGLAPVQREGMEYEFTAFIDIDSSHNATSSKDRTSLLDGRMFQINEDTGKLLLEWLNTGKDWKVEDKIDQVFADNDLAQAIKDLRESDTRDLLKIRFTELVKKFPKDSDEQKKLITAKDERKKFFDEASKQNTKAVTGGDEIPFERLDADYKQRTDGVIPALNDEVPTFHEEEIPAIPYIQPRKATKGGLNWTYWVGECEAALEKLDADKVGEWLKVHEKLLDELKTADKGLWDQVNEIAIKRMG